MKKLAALIGAGAMLFVLAVPVLAKFPFQPPKPKDEATILNFANVKNDIDTKAFTGFNETGGMFGGLFGRRGGGGTIWTGDAIAIGQVSNGVNENIIGCECYDDLFVMNKASVRNDIDTKAFTGFNETRGGTIWSGDATAESIVANLVNVNQIDDVDFR
jgi:hypothetical protein